MTEITIEQKIEALESHLRDIDIDLGDTCLHHPEHIEMLKQKRPAIEAILADLKRQQADRHAQRPRVVY